MSPDELIDIADHAVRSLLVRNHYGVDDHEYDDMRQSALVRMLEAIRQDKTLRDANGYLFVAARHAAFDWLWWWEHGRTYAYCRYTPAVRLVDLDNTTYSIEDIAPDQDRSGLTDDQKAQVERIMLNGRHKRGTRGSDAAHRDVQILDLLVRGHSNFGICQELNIPYCCINSYRFHIRERLEQYAK